MCTDICSFSAQCSRKKTKNENLQTCTYSMYQHGKNEIKKVATRCREEPKFSAPTV